MKQINVWFEDKEHKELIDSKAKHGGNWHDFLMDLLMFWKKDKKEGEE